MLDQRIIIRRIALITLFAASLGTTGMLAAQDKSWSEVDDGSTSVPQLDMTADQLEDASVYDIAGTEIGEVDDVLKSDDDDSMALTVEAGGFLGVGEKKVIMPLDDISQGDKGLTTSMSKEELESLPEYDD